MGFKAGQLLRIFVCTGIICCVTAEVVSGAVCTSSGQCQTSSEQRLLYCCGECGQSFCCENASSEFNATRCQSSEKVTNSSVAMLGVIIGGMFASFIAAMVAHSLARILVKKFRKRGSTAETNDEETAVPVPTEEHVCALPTYEDIHLYKKVEAKERNLPVSESNIISVSKGKHEKDEFEENEEPPPPAYETEVTPDASQRVGINDLTIPAANSESSIAIEDSEIGLSEINSLASVANSLGIKEQPKEVWTAMIRLLKNIDSNNEGNIARAVSESAKRLAKEETSTSSV